MSSDDELSDFKIKNIKYKAKQNKIFKLIKKKIKYDDDEDSFVIENIDRNFMIDEMFQKIKKYFYFDVWGRIDIDNARSHVSLIRKIFIDRGFTLLLKNVNVVDNGKKKRVKKYYVL